MHWFIEGVLWIVLMVALVVVSPLIGDGVAGSAFLGLYVTAILFGAWKVARKS